MIFKTLESFFFNDLKEMINIIITIICVIPTKIKKIRLVTYILANNISYF